MANQDVEKTVIVGENTTIALHKVPAHGKTNIAIRIIHHQGDGKEGDFLDIIDDVFIVFDDKDVLKKFSDNLLKLISMSEDLQDGRCLSLTTNIKQ